MSLAPPPGQVREVFTVGQVARICRVSSRTASKWFDLGLLKGYRIPGSRDRRIPRSALVAFIESSGMPPEYLEEV